MPDLDFIAELSEGLQPDPHKTPVDDSMGYHPYVTSEFPEGAKLLRCDRCGGGPDAAIHQKPVDQMERIADALESLYTPLWESSLDLKRIADRMEAILARIEAES